MWILSSLAFYFACIFIHVMSFSFNFLYPISTLPEHLHSTILRTPKLPENTHKPKETRFLPSLTLVTLLANHLLTSSLGVSPSHTLSSHSKFWRPRSRLCLLCRSYTLCIRLDLMVLKLPVFILPLFIETFSDCFHANMIYKT